LNLVHVSDVDAALLDVNVAGEYSFPVADALAAKGVPFAFVTGYAGVKTLPERFGSSPVVAKPFHSVELVATLNRLVQQGRARTELH
jgi:DNA-binding NtrC family response regulator